ncbi:unnamed protein product [Paramecium sonneborni]|uniref:Uncharacterized protein n=1 Tax=Paramecium sonneborni TaxID=65129 RepID=A0A8S1L684_9CILI|nr:unnamed protein product [Paramecium sonneborni]
MLQNILFQDNLQIVIKIVAFNLKELKLHHQFQIDHKYGIIIGIGNTGLFLDGQETNAYLSSDGEYIQMKAEIMGLIIFVESSTKVAKFTQDEVQLFKKLNQIHNISGLFSNFDKKRTIYNFRLIIQQLNYLIKNKSSQSMVKSNKQIILMKISYFKRCIFIIINGKKERFLLKN